MPNRNSVFTHDQFHDEIEARDQIMDDLWKHYRSMTKGLPLDTLPDVFYTMGSVNSQIKYLREDCGDAYRDAKPDDIPTVDATIKRLIARVDEDIASLKTMLNVE